MGIFRGDGGTGDSNTDATVTAVTEQATIATTKASEAADSAIAAGTSATNAASSASASSVSSAASSTYAGEAASSATSAATSATASAASATAAATAETNAETAETNAETAETNAAASAATATTKAGEAATSATNASTSASTATTKASEASTSASNASTSETNAATSSSTATTKASEASTSASNAATSATNAAASYDDFDDRYLGAKSSAPTTDNDGDALVTGALYFDTTTNSMKVWSGSAWLDAYASLSGALIATNNLSDLNNAATARTNLGLGTAATTAATDYATAAQGTKVDGIEAGADVTDTTNVVAALSAGTGISLSNGGVIANTSPDQTVALTGAGTTTVSGTYPNFTITGAGTTYTAGSGLSLTGTEFANTAPDQTVALTSGTGITTSGTYPNFTITNDSPDQTVALTGAGTTTISGTYPNFTITGAGTTYTAGTGITLTGTEFQLTDTNAKLNASDYTAADVLTKIKTVDGSGSGLDADTVDGVHASGLSRFYNDATLNSSTTTANLIAELINDYGAFSNNQVTLKCSWSYAGNSDLVTGDATVGTIELAGCLVEAWGGTYKHIRITRPTTGTGGSTICVYSDQGSGYSPGWREIWTSQTDGSGSGLDADTLDGVHASGFITTSTAQPSQIAIRNGSPTIYLRDTNNNSSMIHCNANIFYVLRGGVDTTTWTQVNGRWPMQLNLSNNDATFGGNVTAYSDARLKENITSIGNSMEMFNQIDAKRYNWIDNGKNDIGFIAQDVKAAGLVEVVKEAEDRDPETGELFDTHLTLDYSRMVSVLWDVVKELKAEIDELKGGD